MDLRAYGFEPAGRWRAHEGTKSGIAYQLIAFADARVIYAFVVRGTPMYIGVCANRNTTLRSRMDRYKGMTGGGTTARVAKAIRQEIDRGEAVEILAFDPPVGTRYMDLDVDLVKGLEPPLLDRFTPEWNLLW